MAIMSDKPMLPSSQVYLLRLWREPGTEWRISLRAAGDDTPVGFGDLDDLVAFLLREMAARREPPAGLACDQLAEG